MSDRMRGSRFAGLLVLMVAVFLLAWHLLGQHTRALRTEEEQLQVTLSQLQDEAGSLSAQLKVVGTESYVETQARQQYGFLKEGELRFTFDHPEYLEALTNEEYTIYKRETEY